MNMVEDVKIILENNRIRLEDGFENAVLWSKLGIELQKLRSFYRNNAASFVVCPIVTGLICRWVSMSLGLIVAGSQCRGSNCRVSAKSNIEHTQNFHSICIIIFYINSMFQQFRPQLILRLHARKINWNRNGIAKLKRKDNMTMHALQRMSGTASCLLKTMAV